MLSILVASGYVPSRASSAARCRAEAAASGFASLFELSVVLWMDLLLQALEFLRGRDGCRGARSNGRPQSSASNTVRDVPRIAPFAFELCFFVMRRGRWAVGERSNMSGPFPWR